MDDLGYLIVDIISPLVRSRGELLEWLVWAVAEIVDIEL